MARIHRCSSSRAHFGGVNLKENGNGERSVKEFKMNPVESSSKLYKQFLVSKKTRITLFVMGVLWLAVIMQLAVNSFFSYEKNILDALVSTNTEVSSFELEMAAYYSAGYLSEDDRKELVLYIANNIGLQLNQDVTIKKQNNNFEVFIQKKNNNAETLIKLVSVEQEIAPETKEMKHYLLVRLKIYKNLDSVLAYRALLEDIFHTLKVDNLQTTMQLIADYKGKLSIDEKNKIADNMIQSLQGKVAFENRKEDQYTVYAYSGLLKEYVTSMNTKININVAINYDEATDTTKVYLGTPYINTAY